MSIKYWILFSGVCALSSCKWGVPEKKERAITRDTLTYTYKIFKQRAADCDNKPDSGCNIVKFRYPIFKDSKALNDSVITKLTAVFSFFHKTDTNWQPLATEFFKRYGNRPSNITPNNKVPVFFAVNGYAKVIRQDSSLTVVEVGGQLIQYAHPLSFTYFINWNTKAHQIIAMPDLFNSGFENKLKSIGEAIFRKNEKLADTSSLTRDYLFKYHHEKGFYLPRNFSITPLGIRFFYNESEIKPYAAGTTDLFIPYSQIKSLLRPGTVVAQYIK